MTGGWRDTRSVELTWVLSAGIFLAYFDRALPAAAIIPLKTELHLTDAAIGGAIGTVPAIAYAMVAILASRLNRSARWRHMSIIGGMVGWTAGSVGLSLVRTWPALIAAEAMVGAGQALFTPVAAATIANLASRGTQGRAAARYTIASSSGRTSAVLIGGALIAAVSAAGVSVPGISAPWRMMFLITCLPNVLAIMMIVRGRFPDEAPPIEADRARRGWQAVAGCMILGVTPIAIIQAIGLWFPTLIARTAGMTPARAAIMAGAVAWPASIAGQWLGARIVDQGRVETPVARYAVIAGAMAIATVMMAAVARFMPGTGAVLSALAIADLALGVAAVAGLSAVQVILPLGARASGTSVYFAAVTAVGIGIGPLLAGRISDIGGGDGAALATGLGLVAGGSLLVATIGYALWRRDRRIQAESSADATIATVTR